MEKIKGFTLIELIVVLAIVSILLSTASPVTQHFINKQKSQTTAQNLLQLIIFARHSAISTGSFVTVCPSTTLTSCETDWSKGVLVFVDENKDGDIGSSESLLRAIDHHDMTSSISWKSFKNKNYLQFTPRGMTNYQNGTFTICPQNYDLTLAQQLVLNVAGRPYFRKDNDSDGIVDNGAGVQASCS